MRNISDTAWVYGDQATLEACGRARLVMTKTAKNYLAAIWKFREATLGKLTVSSGRLQCVKSPATPQELILRQRVIISNVARASWSEWIPPPPWKQDSVCATSKRAAFYVLYKGKWAGLYYKWSDCVLEMKGTPGALAKGFNTLREAEDAWKRHAFCGARLVSFGGPSNTFVN